ncbi:unnamed protein product [Phytomonas sp. Hart1]|nr:unnamed protein product [Phytomonas sp. Hart1]|eukprot:CCW70752.1 unnamed protein product [Phytomonas sp. isolate Hart1]
MAPTISIPDSRMGDILNGAKKVSFTPTQRKLIEHMIRSGNFDVLLNTLKGFRNGVIYGARVRFPHALVLNLVWSKAPYHAMPGKILQVTKTHALGLGYSAVLFAVVRGALQALTGRISLWHNTLAGFLIGFFFWGDPENGVHLQMIMYKMARVLFVLYRVLAARLKLTAPRYGYALFAGAVWATSLTLMEGSPNSLQSTMQSSLEYIFLDKKMK